MQFNNKWLRGDLPAQPFIILESIFINQNAENRSRRREQIDAIDLNADNGPRQREPATAYAASEVQAP